MLGREPKHEEGKMPLSNPHAKGLCPKISSPLRTTCQDLIEKKSFDKKKIEKYI